MFGRLEVMQHGKKIGERLARARLGSKQELSICIRRKGGEEML
jgi:hypothetical protein